MGTQHETQIVRFLDEHPTARLMVIVSMHSDEGDGQVIWVNATPTTPRESSFASQVSTGSWGVPDVV